MENNLGFKLKRRRGLVVETLHLDEGGGVSERRTTPAASATLPSQGVEQLERVDPLPKATSHTSISQGTTHEGPVSGKARLERRKIRFDDDPNENPSGILQVNAAVARRESPKSGLQRDKLELYDF